MIALSSRTKLSFALLTSLLSGTALAQDGLTVRFVDPGRQALHYKNVQAVLPDGRLQPASVTRSGAFFEGVRDKAVLQFTERGGMQTIELDLPDVPSASVVLGVNPANGRTRVMGMRPALEDSAPRGEFLTGTGLGEPTMVGSNNSCATALPLDLNTFTLTDNFGATEDLTEACGVASGPWNAVWFTVVGDGSTLTLSTCNNGTTHSDTKISVFCGSCDDLRCVAGNDDDCAVGFSSTVSFCSSPGELYFIAVGGFSDTTPAGVFELSVQSDGGMCGVPDGDCAPVVPMGACCVVDGCILTTQDDCEQQGGEYLGDDVPCSENLTRDPSLELGDLEWDAVSSNFGTPLCTAGICGTGGGTGAFDGQVWCWFGGLDGATESGSLSQIVPVTGPSLLSFWLEIPAGGGSGQDFMEVLWRGEIVFTVTDADAAEYATYTLVELLIDAASEPVQGEELGDPIPMLEFRSTTSGMGVTNFFVDQIEVRPLGGPCGMEPIEVLIDFETTDGGDPLVNGEVVTPPWENIAFLAGSIFEGPSMDSLAIFDSSPMGPNAFGPDPDLLADQGNVLIVQSPDSPAMSVEGIFDVPNDNGEGGCITAFFRFPARVKSIDLIDIDMPPGDQSAFVVLFDEGSNLRVYEVPPGWTDEAEARTLDLTTVLDQPGFASVATVVEDSEIDEDAIMGMTICFSASGAIDNLSYCYVPGGQEK